MEKLLVTGATGVSGRSTIAHLLKKEYRRLKSLPFHEKQKVLFICKDT